MICIAGIMVNPTMVVFGLGLLAGLIGVIYRALRSRVSESETETEKNSRRLQTLIDGLYGVDRDDTDDGYVGEITNISEQVDSLEGEVRESRQILDRIDRRLDEVERKKKKKKK